MIDDLTVESHSESTCHKSRRICSPSLKSQTISSVPRTQGVTSLRRLLFHARLCADGEPIQIAGRLPRLLSSTGTPEPNVHLDLPMGGIHERPADFFQGPRAPAGLFNYSFVMYIQAVSVMYIGGRSHATPFSFLFRQDVFLLCHTSLKAMPPTTMLHPPSSSHSKKMHELGQRDETTRCARLTCRTRPIKTQGDMDRPSSHSQNQPNIRMPNIIDVERKKSV